MKCPNCNENNLESAKFCKNCGKGFLQTQNQFNQNESQSETSQGKKNNLVIGVVVVAVILIVLAYFAGQGFFANKNASTSQQQSSNQTQPTASTPVAQNPTNNKPSANSKKDKSTAASTSGCGGQVMDASGITYGTVLAEDGKCWLDRNLGATEVATSATDTAAYGWLFQWGRGADGHQIPTSDTTTTLSSSDNPGNGNFITGSLDWRSPQNDNLWQGVSGINNPCPAGFRLPTSDEWTSLVSDAKIKDDITAFSSSLKLTDAGFRLNNGTLYNQGSYGTYWSSSSYSIYSYTLYFSSGSVLPATNDNRAYGYSVRCVKN